MSSAERQAVLASLPNEVTWEEMAPPEGDRHSMAKARVLTALRRHFNTKTRSVYVGSDVPAYYPAAPRFPPDLMVVLDVPAHPRETWVVSHEGRGLDVVVEVHSGGDRKKDAVRNVARYADHGIPEYFLFDASRGHLVGYRLPSPSARRYEPIIPQGGFWRSDVLDLDFSEEGGRVRLWHHGSPILDDIEWIAESRRMLDRAVEREKATMELALAEATRAEAAEAKAQEEAEARMDAERRVAELSAELERLRRSST